VAGNQFYLQNVSCDHQPDLNLRQSEVQEEMLKVSTSAGHGADGFRPRCRPFCSRAEGSRARACPKLTPSAAGEGPRWRPAGGNVLLLAEGDPAGR